MSRHARPLRPLLAVPGEPDDQMRLAMFRQDHPEVIIGPGGFGTLQALIPEPHGETVITRYDLKALLDKLGGLLG